MIVNATVWACMGRSEELASPSTVLWNRVSCCSAAYARPNGLQTSKDSPVSASRPAGWALEVQMALPEVMCPQQVPTHWAILPALSPTTLDSQMALESQMVKYSLLTLYIQKQKNRNNLAIKWIPWGKRSHVFEFSWQSFSLWISLKVSEFAKSHNTSNSVILSEPMHIFLWQNSQ